MTYPAGITQVQPPVGYGQNGGSVSVDPSSQVNGSAPSAVPSIQLPIPEAFPIPSSTIFNAEGSKSTAAVEGPIVIPGVTVTVPSGNIGIISGVNIYIDDMLETTNVIYNMLFNGAPVPGYNNLTIFPRAAPSVSNGFDIPVRVPPNTVVTFTYQNVDGGSYIVGAAISGWQWSIAAGQRWVQQGYSNGY